MPKEQPWPLLEVQSSTDQAASWGEAGSFRTKGVRVERKQGMGKMAWRLRDTYVKERGSKRRILQATNSHSDTASPAWSHQLAVASWGCSSTTEQ